MPTQHGNNPHTTTTPTPRVEGTPQLSTRTLSWLAQRPHARLLVDSVWDTLAELDAAGHHPRLLAALRFVLIHHEPTPKGRCRACRRMTWRSLWRRRRFPCLVWRQIRGELLGHLTISDHHRLQANTHTARSP